MPDYHFMVGRHDTMQPFKRIKVTAIDTVTGARTTVRTDLNGIAKLTTTNEARLVVHSTEPYELLSLTSLGMNIDYIVDPAGGGTHTTLEDALTAAIATNADKSIWLCKSVTESDIEVGGIHQNATITIASHSPHSVVITANSNEDIFKQTSDGGYTRGGLRFQNVGFSVDVAQAIVQIGTGLEMRHVVYDHCVFNGGYLAGGSGSIGNLRLEVRDCDGNAAGLYNNPASSPPDRLYAWNNTLTLTDWWTNSEAADECYVEGGFYIITNAMTITLNGQNDGWTFKNLTVKTGCSGAAFRSSGTDQSVKAITFENITFWATQSDTDFGDFQSPSINNQHNLFIHGIHGITKIAVIGGQTGTFLTVDSDILNPYISDIHAPDWATVYSGPSITPSVPTAGFIIVEEDNATVDATVTTIDFTEPDTTLVTSSPAGEVNVNMALYALLSGRSGGQSLLGGTGAGDDLLLRGNATGDGEVQFEDTAFHASIVSSNPRLTLDANDYSEYNRAGNYFSWFIGSTEYMRLNAAGGAGGGLTDYDLQIGNVGTPTYGNLRFGDAVLARVPYNALGMDLDGSVIIRNVSGPVTSQIEFAFLESGGGAVRFALPKSGVGNATYNPRSMLIAGPAVWDDDVVTVGYWQTANSIFHNLACDTSGVGADLGVQNDLEVEGDIFTDSLKESTPGSGITIGSGNVHFPDNASLYFGSADDASILYDGTNLVIDPRLVGGGGVKYEFTGTNNSITFDDNVFTQMVESVPLVYYLLAHGDSISHFPQFLLRRAKGTIATPTGVTAGAAATLGKIGFAGHDGTTWQESAYIQVSAREDFNGTQEGTEIAIYNTVLGATIPTRVVRFLDNYIRLEHFLEVAEIAAPATPDAGFMRVYGKSDNKLYLLDDLGVETDLTLGAVGPAGPVGPLGAEGEQGEPGVDGTPGAPGAAGAAGPTGSTGVAGAVGPPGPTGLPGEDGESGPQGVIGATGTTGDAGATGAAGATGPQGIPGIEGEAGAEGGLGPQGVAGEDGATGSTGATGPTGLPGSPGPAGTDGEQGEQGPPGLSGTQDVYRYLNAPDAGPGVVLTTIATAQGVYHHSGPVAEKAERLYVDAKTAPGASGLPCTWSYGDTNDLDTVASWTTIATYTLSSEKSNFTDTMTNAVIPANRLMRVIWGTIVGSPTDGQTVLVTRPVA